MSKEAVPCTGPRSSMYRAPNCQQVGSWYSTEMPFLKIFFALSRDGGMVTLALLDQLPNLLLLSVNIALFINN